MATKIGVNKRTVVHKDSGGTVAFMPDVCKTPQPTGPPVPVPYPNTAMSSDADKGARSVLCDGNPILIQGSCFKQSTGDEAGSAGGVTSAKTRGAAEFVGYSFDVFVEGKGVVRQGDLMLGNKGSAVNTPPAPLLQPPMPLMMEVSPDELDEEEVTDEKLRSTLGYDELVALAKEQEEAGFLAWLTVIFDTDIPEDAYRRLRSALLDGSLPRPEFALLRGALRGHAAGYDRKKRAIVVSGALAREAREDADAAGKLFLALIEEFGHHVDHLLRNEYSTVGGDARLDEGSRLSYALAQMGWNNADRRIFAAHETSEGSVELEVDFADLHAAIDEYANEEEQQDDAQDERYEFFGAGTGRSEAGSLTSYGHRSIEFALRDVHYTEDELRKIYFGNWLRDYSQLVDPKVTRKAGSKVWDAPPPGGGPFSRISREALTKVVDLLAREEFGDRPHFRVTPALLGVYRNEEHIDNPAGIEDARQIDPAFRGPLQPGETAVDPATHLKRYIRSSLPAAVRQPRSHRVQDGESLESLARASGLTWRELAQHNFGTAVAAEVNRHLRDEVGCTRMTRDGLNYVFTSRDQPGIIRIPGGGGELGPERPGTALGYILRSLAGAVDGGRTSEGYRLLGQGLHTLEDYYGHTNFMEVALCHLGHDVEPWVPLDRSRPLPVTSGKFGSLDTAASLILLLGEGSQKDFVCKFERTRSQEITLLLLSDLGLTTTRNYLGGAIDGMNGLKEKYGWVREALCGMEKASAFVGALLGGAVRAMGNQIDDAQTLFIEDRNGNDPTHSQVAKDHDDHPLHALAARMARLAVKDVGAMVRQAWDGSASRDDVLRAAQQYVVHPSRVTAGTGPARIVTEIDRWATAHPSDIRKLSSASWAAAWSNTMSKRLAAMQKEALRVFGVNTKLVDAVERLWKGKEK